MLCEECGRNEAIVHIVQIGPGGRSEKNICMSCAARYGETILRAQQQNVSVNDFLRGIFGSGDEESETADDAVHTNCPNCGMRFQDFSQAGIGCSVCYETFHHELQPLLRRIHGSSVHRGKIPHRSGSAIVLRQEAEQLRIRLKEAVAREEYEKAAEYRDRIRHLEQQMEEG
ncbi:MAG: UvrB/UvrC motif-containing protein [Selenomonas artemidis]